MAESLSGQIERITFTNEETGFTIAKARIDGREDLVTVVGTLIAPMPGEVLQMTGEWQQHPKFGEQFKVAEYKTVIPTTSQGIRRYLGSGLIKGIGPVMAERIVKHFGDDTLNIIENKADKLSAVAGVGKKRIQTIQNAWHEQKEIRDVMIFLQSYGIGSGYATKIFREYGNRSIAVVKGNPYRLATEIQGIGFVTADRIAEKLGFSKRNKLRVEAGLLYVLQQLADEGHVYYADKMLVDKSLDMLDVDQDAISRALSALTLSQKTIIEDLNEGIEPYQENSKAVYLEPFYVCETRIAQSLKALCQSPKKVRVNSPDKALAWVQNRLSIALADKQIEAIRCVLESKVTVVTGGPGTGKTTIIHGVLEIYKRLKAKILLAAPTGRAAKRMSEATDYEAKTIHRLLEFSFAKGGFQRNEGKPLECDLLVVDEASMIDTVLMHHLMKAVPQDATFILVGDVYQLPSVGAGNVLGDIIESGTVPVVRLTEIFRQAKASQIVVNAHKINEGILPDFDSSRDSSPERDFYFIQQEDPEKALDIIVQVTIERIPQRFGFDPLEDIQVLTPMHKGAVGAENLNTVLQRKLNPGSAAVVRGARSFRVGDKVMQIRNNYDKDVYNGDIGKIAHIDPIQQMLLIVFDDRSVSYSFGDLDEIVLAYAVSIHKSQGSEFPAVVIPILTQHYILLQRNLIYTAVTRGKHLVVIVGAKKAMAMGINNNKTQSRFTRLAHRLRA